MRRARFTSFNMLASCSTLFVLSSPREPLDYVHRHPFVRKLSCVSEKPRSRGHRRSKGMALHLHHLKGPRDKVSSLVGKMEELRILIVPTRDSASYPTRTVASHSVCEGKKYNSLYGILCSSYISYRSRSRLVGNPERQNQSRTKIAGS